MAVVILGGMDDVIAEFEFRLRQALDAAGYNHEPATEEAVRSCFLDFVYSGYWYNLNYDDDDLNEISIKDICRALSKQHPGCSSSKSKPIFAPVS
jgi:hypothetical protein